MNFRILPVKAFCTAFLAGVLALAAAAQKPYTLSGAGEAAWIGGGGAGIGISLLLRHNTPPFTPDEVAALDAGRISAFDRFATRHYSAAARRQSDIFLFSAPAIPLLLLADPAVRRDAPTVGLIAGEVMLVNTALTLLSKEIAHRPRPFAYNPAAPLPEKLKRDARLSFFSGHTSTVAALAFSTAKIWSDYHPDSGWRPVMWAGAAVIPATVGYLRMRAGKHFLSDVAAGFAAGAVTGWLIPQLHRRR